MKFLTHVLLLVGLCLLVVSCSRSQGALQAGGDPITGMWVGDFGPAFYDRNTISLDLHWDGTKLTGMIKPGVQGGRMYRNFAGIPIENAVFDPNSGTIKFDATYEPRGRRYFIEGKVKNNALTGTWKRPDEKRDGDFKLTRK